MQSIKTKTVDPDLDSSGGGMLTWILFAVVMTLLFGLLYPAVTTLLGQTIFPSQARGSLIEKNGVVVGSSLIGQTFLGDKYFIGRPSSAGNGYDPTSASGSNLAPSNPALKERIATSAKDIAAREGVTPNDIPADLITSSGSGLDPDISPKAAEIQVARVARVRGISEAAVREAVTRHTQPATFGILGQPRVNVLELNLDLDGQK
jgi:potassium-transporting ATPase KdpC subunit